MSDVFRLEFLEYGVVERYWYKKMMING